VNAGDTVIVVGATGAVNRVDVPVDVHARERFDAAVANGSLKLVAADQVKETTSRHGGTILVLVDGATPSGPPDPATDTGDTTDPSGSDPDGAAGPTVEMPAKSAGRGDWDDYARAQGMSDDEITGHKSKADLIAALTAGD
jgi:hypothetical protein